MLQEQQMAENISVTSPSGPQPRSFDSFDNSTAESSITNLAHNVSNTFQNPHISSDSLQTTASSSDSHCANNFHAALALASRFHSGLIDVSNNLANGSHSSFPPTTADLCFSNHESSDASAPILYSSDANRVTPSQCLLMNGALPAQPPVKSASRQSDSKYVSNAYNNSPGNEEITQQLLLSQLGVVSNQQREELSSSADSNSQLTNEDNSVPDLSMTSRTGSNSSNINSKKREQRLIKNREAARECRRKKKEYVRCLENRVSILENQNLHLIAEIKRMRVYARSLKDAMQTQGCSTNLFPNEDLLNNENHMQEMEVNVHTLMDRESVESNPAAVAHQQRAQLMNDLRSLITPLDGISQREVHHQTIGHHNPLFRN
ncbi:pKID domain [Cichlidogyrus casuarinus]|uniref:PKID domain n=1 Tax=Cichlidogyrus casuarinus TaxID=1844966 RepID=A0ABD2Q883_9PLAT